MSSASREGLEDGWPALDDLEQLLVRNGDQGVDLVAQLRDALLGLAHPLLALELEGLGDRADGEGTDLLLGDLGDTGAAPVPVPPPSPQVMKTMSAPFSASLMSSRCSAAAPAPTSGLAPAPRPLVRLWPMPILTSASQAWSAWASVLTAMNSTPPSPASTIRLTASAPPPPTPTTLITAR